MLCLSRKVDEAITIGDDVVIRVLSIAGGRVRFGIEAPKTVPIMRDELNHRQPPAKSRDERPAA